MHDKKINNGVRIYYADQDKSIIISHKKCRWLFPVMFKAKLKWTIPRDFLEAFGGYFEFRFATLK